MFYWLDGRHLTPRGPSYPYEGTPARRSAIKQAIRNVDKKSLNLEFAVAKGDFSAWCVAACDLVNAHGKLALLYETFAYDDGNTTLPEVTARLERLHAKFRRDVSGTTFSRARAMRGYPPEANVHYVVSCCSSSGARYSVVKGAAAEKKSGDAHGTIQIYCKTIDAVDSDAAPELLPTPNPTSLRKSPQPSAPTPTRIVKFAPTSTITPKFTSAKAYIFHRWQSSLRSESISVPSPPYTTPTSSVRPRDHATAHIVPMTTKSAQVTPEYYSNLVPREHSTSGCDTTSASTVIHVAPTVATTPAHVIQVLPDIGPLVSENDGRCDFHAGSSIPPAYTRLHMSDPLATFSPADADPDWRMRSTVPRHRRPPRKPLKFFS